MVLTFLYLSLKETFRMVMFNMLYKMNSKFEFVDEILKPDPSNMTEASLLTSAPSPQEKLENEPLHLLFLRG